MSARSPLRSLLPSILLAFLLSAVIACQPKTPEEKVAAARAAYTVELNSWFPQEPEPVAETDAMAEGEEAEGETAEGEPTEEEVASEEDAGDEAAEGEDGEDGELQVVDVDDVGPRTVDVFFDLIVLFEGDEPLPGLTLDVTQADANGTEKKSWRHYQELPAHIKGETKQVSFELDGIEFTEGDVFSVAVREVVPPEERGDYPEFASAGQ